MVLLLVGTVFFSKWSEDVYYGLHPCYLIYMILGWVFYPLFFSVLLTCALILHYRLKWIKEHCADADDLSTADQPTCCCNDFNSRNCCSRCDEWCFGIPPRRAYERFNNSCCCDGCCGCCIDCCVYCCGETSRPLPPDITENDIVYGPDYERAIYTHSEQSIPMAVIAPVQLAPMNPIPVVVPSG